MAKCGLLAGLACSGPKAANWPFVSVLGGHGHLLVKGASDLFAVIFGPQVELPAAQFRSEFKL